VNDVVFDASAVLTLLHEEQGAARVRELLPGAMISTVNLAEVVARLAERSLPEQEIRRVIDRLRLRMWPLDADLAFAAGLLRPATRRLGLSLGDRVCMALAQRLNAVAVTADHAWSQLDVGVRVELLRGP
jgi:ribonuclease VapC